MSTTLTEAPDRRLAGRRSECAALDELVAGVRAGRSGALVLCGEPGAGKTALLEYLLGRTGGCRTARAAGIESEAELAFAGLHQLCAPFLDRLGALPGPQHEALSTAFSLRDGAAPDRLAVGLAALSLLSDVARERPLVCVVDDAQWLDPASARALAFVAHHLAAGPVAMVFAVRGPAASPALAGLAELTVAGLADGAARELLGAAVTGPLDERVRDRIVAETGGNPLALLNVARGLTPEELAGGFGLLPAAAARPGPAEEAFARRLAALPPATRQLLLVAAAEPVQDSVLVWQAASQLGVAAEAAAPAAAAGLIEAGGQVRFCHPMARSAAYRAASPAERQRAHRALAQATDPAIDPDRRAWHRAHAAAGLDEDVAAELERATGQARARGGLAAAAAFRARGAELTPDPRLRARRALTAARSKFRAGAPDAARRLLGMAPAGLLDELGQAQAELLRAQLAAGSGQGQDAPQLLLAAAARLGPLHPRLARAAYRDAFGAALAAGRLGRPGAMLDVARAVRAAHPVPPTAEAGDLMLHGLATLTAQGYAAGAPMLKLALAAARDQEIDARDGLRWLPLACRIAHDLLDDESLFALSGRLTRLARQSGALTVLPDALMARAVTRLLAGDAAAAAALTREAGAVARATGSPAGSYGPLLLASWRGQEADAARLITVATAEMTARGEGRWLATARWSAAVLANGLGRYDEALAAAEQACEYPHELATWSMAELVEAAARAGCPERADVALRRLTAATSASGTDWALGIQARCRALLTEDDGAEPLYREAITRLGRTRVRAELARAHLLYGEWLRRRKRRSDAREQLRLAYEQLAGSGLDGFAERARRELLATGETVRRRTVETVTELTAQEAQIVRLAGAGHTNPEIGSQLFISARTVEWHLRKVFTKLGISSRKELRDALPELERAGVPAGRAGGLGLA
jgi:DNA-binding CsgD family transcriptional regulator